MYLITLFDCAGERLFSSSRGLRSGEVSHKLAVTEQNTDEILKEKSF
jgi:hypothetical protein